MSEWRQERPPLTETHLAEIRERTKDGNILDWPNIDRAVLLAEVDRLRAQVAAVERLASENDDWNDLVTPTAIFRALAGNRD